ncbi:MAG: histidine kinase dimerization/phosphoacceptor domain -containing protein [Marinoscillum sp.]
MKPALLAILLMVGHLLVAQSLSDTLEVINNTPNPNLRLEKLKQNFTGLDQLPDSLKSEVLLSYGISYGMLSYADSAIAFFNQVINQGGEVHHYVLARAYNGIGNVLRRSGENERSLDNFLKALRLVEDKTDTKSIRFEASIIGNVSGIYFNLGNLPKAREFTTRSIDMAKQLDDEDQLAYGYVALALIADNEGNWNDAIEAHRLAAKYIDEGGVDYLRGFNQLNLGEIYERKGQSDQALTIYEGVAENEQINVEARMTALTKTSKIFKNRKMYGQAVSLANQTLELAQKHSLLSQSRDSKELLSQIYEEKGDYRQAIAELKKFMILKDSLVNSESINALSELETKYETEKKEKEIATLALQNQQKSLMLEKQASEKLLFIVAILGLILLLSIGIWLYRQKIKFNTILTSKNATISAALTEREVLLKEIHHRVKNNLQIISSLLNMQSRFIEDKTAVDAVKEGRNRVKSMALIHQKLYQQENIKGINMPEYVENLTNALLKSYKIPHDQLHVIQEVQPISLDIDTAIPLGLILNELLTNSLKYAFPENQPGELSIRLNEHNESLLLEVQDNGKGFTRNENNQNSFGLTLIDSLAEKLNARVDLIQENGTKYLIKITNYKLA